MHLLIYKQLKWALKYILCEMCIVELYNHNVDINSHYIVFMELCKDAIIS